MDVEFLVWKRETCAECEGKKHVQHPLWAQFFNEFKEWPEREEENKWWREHGYYVHRHGGFNLPPEYIPCSECEGEGIIERHVSLQEALKAITAVTP